MSSAGNDGDGSPTKNDLVYLLYRMGEPLYFPKGDDPSERRIFELSPDFIPNKFNSKAQEILTRFNADEESGRRVFIGGLLKNALLKIPLDRVKVIKRHDQFSLLIPQHRRAATYLLNIFLNLRSINDLIAFAGYCRDQLNAQLFAYAYATALLHRTDTKNLRLPSEAEIFPAKFVNSEVILDATENATVFEGLTDPVPVEIPLNLTGNNSNVEHRLAYWREDIGLNLFYWHWHLVYPYEGPVSVVAKDRRGELFYYIHTQMLARYNLERLCNKLNITHRLMNWDEPIPEAYFPMMSSDIAGKGWAGRPENMTLSNINRPDTQLRFDLEDMKRFKERIFEAINRNKVITSDGKEISINNNQGIDILGNMIEASILTPNADYYGNLNNMGHLAIAYIHDPKYKHTKERGAMGDFSVAARDPLFYRWHAFIDDIFQEHKKSLRPYDKKTVRNTKKAYLPNPQLLYIFLYLYTKLTFPGIQLTNVELCSYKDGKCRPDKNTLHTYMMKSDINVSRGLDFVPHGPILARMTHLNHDEFHYTIDYSSTYKMQVWGTVRIFLILVNGFGDVPLNLSEQRHWAIEMDKFIYPLDPGTHSIQRKSTTSSVTIPFEQIFRDIDTNRPSKENLKQFDQFNFCGCGWPHSLLVPRGTTEGYSMILFAMISDYNIDKTDSSGSIDPKTCRTGDSFCGLRDEKYPDSRPMGFPFDRPASIDVETIKDFQTPNMAIKPVTIFHSNEVKQGRILTNATPITPKSTIINNGT